MSDEMSAEPVAWPALLKAAQEIVESKPTWKHFIDGTPLANDIAVWMADFAQEHAQSPSVARAMAIAECASMVERWEATYDGADSDLSLLADDMRSLSPAPSVTEEWVAEIINSIPGGVNSEDCYSVVRATLAALGVEVK